MLYLLTTAIRIFGYRNRIVIVEGNYLLLDEDDWKDLRDLFDETWLVLAAEDVTFLKACHVDMVLACRNLHGERG